VPAVESLQGIRVVADPAAIDMMLDFMQSRTTVVRIAPDEAFVGGVTGVSIEDPHAIIEAEVGFVALTVDREVIERHTEWRLPAPGEVEQGSIAGVPAKLAWLPDGRGWVVTHAAYAAELQDRLR
jgi:hypothetical protein